MFEIVSVDGNDLVVKDAAGAAKEIVVPADFKFTVGGKQVPVGELKPGMKGKATVTTTTTVTPVFVTEVKDGVVMKNVGAGSVIIRTKDGVKMFSQGQIRQARDPASSAAASRCSSPSCGRAKTDRDHRDRGQAAGVTEKQVEATLAAAAAAPLAAVPPPAVVPAAEPAATAAPAAAPPGELGRGTGRDGHDRRRRPRRRSRRRRRPRPRPWSRPPEEGRG